MSRNMDLIGIRNGNRLWIQAVLDASALAGDPVMDKQPHKLVVLLGELIGNPRVHPDAEFFSEILSRLGPLLVKHFTDEELIFIGSGWTGDEIAGHVEAHSVILDQCTQLSFDLMQGVFINRLDALRSVRRWIFEHIVTYDMKFKSLSE